MKEIKNNNTKNDYYIMLKIIRNVYFYYIKSWDFILSVLLSLFYIIFIFTGKGNQLIYFNITKNFSIFIPILTIFITIFTLSLSILVTSTTDEFIDYLEEKGKGAYSKLIEYHKVGFIIYFSALFLNISLQITYEFKPSLFSFIFFNYISNDLNIFFRIIYVTAVFFTIYSFFYTISLINHILKLTEYKVKYKKKYNNNS